MRPTLRTLSGPLIFNEELPDYGDLITVDTFRQCCKNKMFIDYDGYGNPVKSNKCANVLVLPSQVHLVPPEVTHIMWYNR